MSSSTPTRGDLEPLLPPHPPHNELYGGRRRRDDHSSCDDQGDDGNNGNNDDEDGSPSGEHGGAPSTRRRRQGSPSGLSAAAPSSASHLPGLPSGASRPLVAVRAAAATTIHTCCSGLLSRMTVRERTVLVGLLAVSSAVTFLVHAALRGHVVLWQLAAVNAAVVLLFARDRQRFSPQFAARWTALLLLVAAPVLSGPAVLLMAGMVAAPLQFAIHRHRQAVTLEARKQPPHARVKSVDAVAHRDHAVLALAYYTGHVVLWKVPYEKDQGSVPPEAPAIGVEVCPMQPLRSVRFVARRTPESSSSSSSSNSSEPDPWNSCSLLAAGDDGRLVQVDGATMSIEVSTKAHSDFCRCVEVHPTHPTVMTAADDCSVKLWQAAADKCGPFAVTYVLEGHDDFVMQVKCHPDGASFVSASLDATLRKWALESTASDVTVPSLAPALTFRGHSQGVNCVDFLVRDGAPTVLVSGSDDLSIRFWNYHDGSLIRTIPNAHQDNVNAILVHRTRPIMISACEDGACHVWSVRVDDTGGVDVLRQEEWNLNKGRAWALAWVGPDYVAIGCDQGCGVVRVRSDDRRKHDGVVAPSSSPSLPNPQEQVRWLSEVEFVEKRCIPIGQGGQFG